ncbi:low-specificity L-threonine aldolase [Paraburkholderia diazotrophica]|uniref:low-specificity L-threonine aldolase n=1 Tax=Paraburkholderia diazotrophica TaxID=667676 RepID=UPI003173BD1A
MIDLRSDTVTLPSPGMRACMSDAAVGDDVYGEDPTVRRLEHRMACDLGFEAAVFSSSGTQSNLLALLAHCERGDEYIAGQEAHTYKFEGGGAAVLGSIQPQPIEVEADGTLDLLCVQRAIKPSGDPHFARSRLLCLENTIGGRVLPLEYLSQARTLVDSYGLKLHLDGARLYNAAIALGVEPEAIAKPFDSVSVCLSKGLGAPVGAVLCGSAQFINTARRWRKVLGGGMRQAGILASAGLYALVERLKTDHQNAERLADELSKLDGLSVRATPTNMVFVTGDKALMDGLTATLKRNGILVSGRYGLRLVTHMGVSASDIDAVIATAAKYIHRGDTPRHSVE